VTESAKPARQRSALPGLAAGGALVLALIVSAPAAPRRSRPRLTVVADSVAGALAYAPARRYLRRWYTFRLAAGVCRRLVAPSCEFNHTYARSALEAVHHRGRRLGKTVVLDVGYNDAAETYAADLDRVLGALKRLGVRKVVVVTMRANGIGNRLLINAAIRTMPEPVAVHPRRRLGHVERRPAVVRLRQRAPERRGRSRAREAPP
jgi:hypothetical protein